MKGTSRIANLVACAIVLVIMVFGFGCEVTPPGDGNGDGGDGLTGDPWRGAKLFDDWRFYNTAEGTGTFAGGNRCRECHGWQGETPVGSDNRSLTARVAGLTEAQIADTIENGVAAEGMPTFGGLFAASYDPAQQYADLAAFVRNYLREFDLPPTAGTASEGQTVFAASCRGCHGVDGMTIDFHQGTGEPPEYLGAADDEATEFAHRILYGHSRPNAQQTAIWDTAMPTWGNTWGYPTDATTITGRVADLIAHLQTLPTE